VSELKDSHQSEVQRINHSHKETLSIAEEKFKKEQMKLKVQS
jgi:hypothetical protein